jgi:hypothetical protein
LHCYMALVVVDFDQNPHLMVFCPTWPLGEAEIFMISELFQHSLILLPGDLANRRMLLILVRSHISCPVMHQIRAWATISKRCELLQIIIHSGRTAVTLGIIRNHGLLKFLTRAIRVHGRLSIAVTITQVLTDHLWSRAFRFSFLVHVASFLFDRLDQIITEIIISSFLPSSFLVHSLISRLMFNA